MRMKIAGYLFIILGGFLLILHFSGVAKAQESIGLWFSLGAIALGIFLISKDHDIWGKNPEDFAEKLLMLIKRDYPDYYRLLSNNKQLQDEFRRYVHSALDVRMELKAAEAQFIATKKHLFENELNSNGS